MVSHPDGHSIPAPSWGKAHSSEGSWVPTDLPEPGALQKECAGPEALQDDVVSEEHLQKDAEGSSKDSECQQGVEVLVQCSIAVVMEAEEQT